MEPLRVLLDEGLLLELLFGRPLPMDQGDRLWDLLLECRVQGYVTDFALAQVGRYALRSHSESTAKATLNQLCRLLHCCPVDTAIIHTAMGSQLGLPSALHAAVVTHLGLDGVVTHRPLDYVTDTGADEVPVYTPGYLLVECAQPDWRHRRTSLETQYQEAPPGDHRQWFGQLELVEVSGGRDRHTATVRLQTPLGYVCEETATGVGPVDAALQALTLAVNHYIPVEDVRMVHFRCLATTADSEVSAVVLLERQMAVFPGRGLHQNVIMASINAYLDALGYLIFCERL